MDNDEQRQRKRDDMRRYRKDRETVTAKRESVERMRDLALRLNLVMPRGYGAGRVGNIALLIDRLARVYERNPDGVMKLLDDADDEPARAA